MTENTRPTPNDRYLAADSAVDAAALLGAFHVRDFGRADDILRTAEQPVQVCRTLTMWALRGIAATCEGNPDKVTGYLEAMTEDLIGHRDAAHAAVLADNADQGGDGE